MDKELQHNGFHKVDYAWWHNSKKSLSISYDFKIHAYKLFTAATSSDLTGKQICSSESLENLMKYVKKSL